jgi:methanogenic corrinoid protein MtbC1
LVLKNKKYTIKKREVFDLEKDFKLQKFNEYLNCENKEKCTEIYLKALEENEGNLLNFYNDYIIGSIKNWYEEFEKNRLSIWKEHVRSSILRTLVECSYPHVIKLGKKAVRKNKKILIACPAQEKHDLGARIVSDYFEISGFDTIYAGNTLPLDTLIEAIEFEKPDFLALSVTTKYNFIFVIETVKKVTELFPDLEIYLGGQGLVGDVEKLKIFSNIKIINLKGIFNKEGAGQQ